MSSNKIDGDDVFRIACSVEEIAQKTAYLTTRDYFAAKAMQVLLARGDGEYTNDEEMAENCYMIADAMVFASMKRSR